MLPEDSSPPGPIPTKHLIVKPPLLFRSGSGHMPIVKLLIKAGADVRLLPTFDPENQTRERFFLRTLEMHRRVASRVHCADQER